jgi:carbamoyltransferase
MKVLGTKFFQHDSAAFVLDFDQKEIFAMSTERVTRIKHDNFDISPILKEYPEQFKDVEHVAHAFSDFDKTDNPYGDLGASNIAEARYFRAYRALKKPQYISDLLDGRKGKFILMLKNTLWHPFMVMITLVRYLSFRFADDGSPENNKKSVDSFTNEILTPFGLGGASVSYYDHHLSHAIGSYYFSTFDRDEKVICMTIDGSGDGYFSKLYLGKNGQLELIGGSPNIIIPDVPPPAMTSLGEIYTRFTVAMDLRSGSDEGKVEALAAYGKRDENIYNYLRTMTEINGLTISFDLAMIKNIYNDQYLRSERARVGDESFCASVQDWLGDTLVDYLNIVGQRYPDIHCLALSGGIAANIIMSLNIFERTQFKNVFVLPFMADDGASAGAAILKALDLGMDVSWLRGHEMPYFGSMHKREDVGKQLEHYRSEMVIEDLGENWHNCAAKDIFDGKVISVFNGRMEFGPRALGNRSILANPLCDKITDRINANIKRRPYYQPFCPSILEDERSRLFKQSFSHKHMAIAFRLKEEFRNELPGAAHVDGTARPQFVSPDDNRDYWKLLNEFRALSGYGVVINTSFNLHGRTIVRTPHDAVLDFRDCNMDALYIEGFRVSK